MRSAFVAGAILLMSLGMACAQPTTPTTPLGNATISGSLDVKGPMGSAANPGLQIFPPLHADGVTSDDAILQAAINSCSANGGTVYLPPGKILLTGAAGTINLHNCAIVGVGVLTSANAIGTEIDLTSTTVVPFTIGLGWSVSGVNFWWPNQNGSTITPYPALMQSDPAVGAGDFYLDNDTIINAYDGIVGVGSQGWGRFYISGGNYYAAHNLFAFGSIGDSAHITNLHMTPGPWLARCASSSCTATIDAAAQNNTILRGTSGHFQEIYWSNSGTFDWRYGILVDAGGEVFGQFSIAWDGMGTIVDASSGGVYPVQSTLVAGGSGVCGGTFSYASNSYTSHHPCFNMGSASGLTIEGAGFGSSGDGIVIGAGILSLSNSAIDAGPSANGGGNTYVVNATGPVQMYFNNVTFGGVPGDAGIHGITSTAAAPARFTCNNCVFGYLNEAINTKTSPTTLITGSWSYGTTGPNSVIFTDATYPTYLANNQWDKGMSTPGGASNPVSQTYIPNMAYTSSGPQPSLMSLIANPSGTTAAAGNTPYGVQFLFPNDETDSTGSGDGYSGVLVRWQGLGAVKGGHTALNVLANIGGAADVGNPGFTVGINDLLQGTGAIGAGNSNMIAFAPYTSISAGSTGYGLIESIEGSATSQTPLSGGRFGTVMYGGGPQRGNVSQGDAAFVAGAPWGTAYAIGAHHAAWGVDPTGTIIGPLIQTNAMSNPSAYLPQQAALGANFGSVNFGSGFAYVSPGFQIDASGNVYSGGLAITTSGVTTSLDTAGYTGSTASMSNPGASYQAGDQIYDTLYNGILSVDTVNGGGNITTFHWIRAPHYFGGSPPATLALVGGRGNQGAVANLTWTIGTTLALGTTSATAINIGNSGSTTTLTGTIKAGASAGVTCSGAPTSSFASINGIVTHC